jgi:hypothetical protein
MTTSYSTVVCFQCGATVPQGSKHACGMTEERVREIARSVWADWQATAQKDNDGWIREIAREVAVSTWRSKWADHPLKVSIRDSALEEAADSVLRGPGKTVGCLAREIRSLKTKHAGTRESTGQRQGEDGSMSRIEVGCARTASPAYNLKSQPAPAQANADGSTKPPRWADVRWRDERITALEAEIAALRKKSDEWKQAYENHYRAACSDIAELRTQLAEANGALDDVAEYWSGGAFQNIRMVLRGTGRLGGKEPK